MKTLLLELHKKLFSMPWAALAMIAAGFGAVAAALTLQSLGLAQPCILCIYQRYPYLIAGFLGILALLLRKNDRAVQFLFLLCAVAFVINSGIALYHSGVERQWWAGTDGCEVGLAPLTSDPAALRMALLTTPVSQCDVIDFLFLGLSLANWNILICLGLAGFALLVAAGPCVRWARFLDEKDATDQPVSSSVSQ